jgi:pimeloyl-ACP methyl ester carboxylesterase
VRLLLLPGLDGTGQLFRWLIERLPPSLQPTVVSYPADISSYSRLLPIVQSALPVGEQFVIVGESYSGPLAVLAAAERPRGLAGVILVATFARSPWPRWFSAFGQFVGAPLLRWVPRALVARALLGSGPESISLVQCWRESISALSPAVLARRLREVLSVDVTEALGRVEVPLLYLAARRDVLVSASAVRLIQRYARNIRVVTLDAPHLLLQVAPAEAARQISEFAAHAVAF